MTLLVFGMDGAVREYVEEAIDRGLMPNTEKFIEEGAFGEMKSSTPPITIPAWITMFSGNKPGKFGVYHMTEMDEDYNVNSVPSSRWKGEMLWDKLEGSFGLINIPGTSPIWPVNGYVVEGFPMVTDPSFYPEDLEGEIPDYDFVEKDAQSTREGRRKGNFKNFKERKRIFSEIDRDVDVRMEVYQLTDTSAHRSANMDQVLEAYGEVDEVLGDRMEEYEDILLVSDHGFTHVDQFFYINRWLEEKGFLTEKSDEEKGSTKSWTDKVRDLLMPLAETRLRPYLKFVNDILRKNTSVDFSPKGSGVDDIDFEETQAFCFRGGANNYGDINVNDDRFSKGIVDDREGVMEEIKSELENEEAVEKVWRREEVYDETEGMPDLIFKTREDTGVGISLFSKVYFDTDAFIHNDRGIVGAWGDSFTGGEVEEAQIIDVAPTISHYIGQELDVDGNVLKQLFVDNFEPKEPEGGREGVEDIDF